MTPELLKLVKDWLTRPTPQGIGRLEQIFSERVADDLFMLAARHGADSPEVLRAIETAEKLAAKQAQMKERRTALPPKPAGTVRPRGKFRALSKDSRYRINKWGEVVGPQGKTLSWNWDLLSAIPSVTIGGNKCSILSLLQDAGFQKRKERPTKPTQEPTVNDSFEAMAEDPELHPPKGFESLAEAQAEEPETYGVVE